ncbi:MAG: hypothetical protein HC804_12260 [Anaerolineae bacterium]|nr:hypothetical protein [Anaerolineae bacterium]
MQPVDTATIDNFVNQFPPDTAPTLEGEAAEASIEQIQGQVALISDILQSLEGLDLPMPWWREPLPTTAEARLSLVLGMLFTWVAVSQGSSFWYDILKAIKPGSSPPPPPKRSEDD